MNVYVRETDDGRVWLGVGVCLTCEPDATVRRPFEAGQPCPGCRGAGVIEWRWWPDLMPGAIPSAGQFPAGLGPPSSASSYITSAPSRRAAD